MFSVKVITKSTGKPLKYAKIKAAYSGLGGMTDQLLTDGEGMAHFDYRNGEGTVYVNGESRFKGQIKGLIVIYV